MARRHYSDADRATALAVFDGCGGSFEAAARQAGVPRSSLRRWVADRDNAAPAELRQEKAEGLADMFEAEVRAAYECLDARRGEAGYRELATVIGIMTEKMLLLRGKNTARAEVVVRYVDDWRDADTQGD